MSLQATRWTLPALLLAGVSAEAKTYTLVPAESSVMIHVGKSGVFSGFAHEHDVAAPLTSGQVTVDDSDLPKAAVTATFDARRLTVVPEHEPKDAPKVQETMRGPEVLDAQRFPRIRFTSTRVVAKRFGGGNYQVDLTGNLELHGVVRQVTLPLRVQLLEDQLIATGRVALRQTAFGITPIRLAGGAVTVPDELNIQLKVVARAAGAQ
jgi:polyisoprenoid-binding protein YceI